MERPILGSLGIATFGKCTKADELFLFHQIIRGVLIEYTKSHVT